MALCGRSCVDPTMLRVLVIHGVLVTTGYFCHWTTSFDGKEPCVSTSGLQVKHSRFMKFWNYC